MMSEKSLAIAQIDEARKYTNSILDTIPISEWLRFPEGCPSNIAWQVGHLAMASYRLCLERIRGVHPGDDNLIPQAIFDLYGKGTSPDSSPERNLPPSEIREIANRVHELVMQEQKNWTDEFLLGEAEKPHRLFTQKIDAIWWCCRHEMLHAGQIGLIRRMLGAEPIW